MYKVYLISTGNDIKKYKIGFTKRNVENRINEMKTGNSEDFHIEGYFESKWGTKIESSLHNKYKSKKISGEWFNLTDDESKGFIDECKQLHDIFEFLSKENTYLIDRGMI